MAKKFSSSSSYSKTILFFYDYFVLRFSCKYLWQCSKEIMLGFYNTHISALHLDVGVGTGYFPDQCNFPIAQPTIHLLDLNPNSLQATATRIKRYHPIVHCADIMQPLTSISTRFDSISISFLLHCLPGNMLSKECVFKNLIPLLNNGGIIFGATVLGQNNKTNFLAKQLMNFYNAKGIFTNHNDTIEDLEKILANNFNTYSVTQVGCTALFWGRI